VGHEEEPTEQPAPFGGRDPGALPSSPPGIAKLARMVRQCL
jgi:hypothetical protein